MTWGIRFFFATLCAISWTWMPLYGLTQDDIPRAMQRLFNLHIENKEFTSTLVQRSVKVYLDQFDPEHLYLLESEVSPYLNLSDRDARQIAQRLKEGDYRDFLALNQIFQKAVLRAREIRGALFQQLAQRGPSDTRLSQSSPYARSIDELRVRQQAKLERFYGYHKTRTHSSDSQTVMQKVCSLFDKKCRRMERFYVGTDQEEHFFTLRLLKALAKSLDTHTAFFSPDEAREMRVSLEKQFEGVGIVLSEGIDGVVIADLIPGSPAAESGNVRVDDLLVEIDGTPISTLEFDQVLDLLKGKHGSSITLGLQRLDQGDRLLRVNLVKRPISMDQDKIQSSYEPQAQGGIGKIILYSFYENEAGDSSEKDIRAAIDQFRRQGPLTGLILDLRENSGGFLSQAVKVAGLFISNGVVVISKYGKGEVHYLRSVSGRTFFNGPLVILTSKMSASAAEIVAQTLQDYGVALVVGDEHTFGKGSIQYQTVTDPRSDFFFKVTVGRYYTVSGKSTQIEGVLADIVVPTSYAPYKIGERFLEYPLSPDQVSPAFVDPLTDLDAKVRILFQTKYLPYLQRVVPFWRRMLPILRENSQQRILRNPEFQALFKKQERIRARLDGMSPNSIDESVPQMGMGDMQMQEAINILRDMLRLEAQSKTE